MRRARSAAWLAAATAFALSSSGCADGLLFRNDHALTLLSPAQYGTVHPPFELRWSFARALSSGPCHDGGDASQFGVFVDSSPLAPGKRLVDMSLDEQAKVITTASPDVTVRSIVSASDSQSDHDIVVVLLDCAGRRLGETALVVHVTVDTAS